jgi:hypothetical protein
MSFSAKGVAHRTVTVALDRDLYDRIKGQAVKDRRSVSSFLAKTAEDFFASGVAHPTRKPRAAKAAK